MSSADPFNWFDRSAGAVQACFWNFNLPLLPVVAMGMELTRGWHTSDDEYQADEG